MKKYQKWQKFENNTNSGFGVPGGLLLFGLGCFGFIALVAYFYFNNNQILNYIDLNSIVLVFGGLFIVGIVSFSFNELIFTAKRVFEVLRTQPENPKYRIYVFGNLAHLVRAEGLLALESESRKANDSFLRRALELAADSNSEKDLVRILETEKVAFADRERRSIEVLETFGNFSPGIGLIGTLIGLVDLMSVLNNPAAVGPSMSLALLTTLYGALLSNLIFLPLAARLKIRSEEDTVLRLLTIEATVSLLKTENPTLLEQRLETFLPAFSESRKAA